MQIVDGLGQVVLFWSQPALNGSTLQGYSLRITPDCACTGREINDPAATSTGIEGLAPGTEYYFEIRATSNVGPSEYSPRSDPVIALPTFKAMSWNIHRGLEQGGRSGNGPIGAFVEEIIARQVDIAGFQEITEDQANEMAFNLGWQAYWQRSADPCDIPEDQECVEYGNAILSSYPILESQPWQLPPSEVENGRVDHVLLKAVVSIEGFDFHIYNTHLASDVTDDELFAQADAVVQHIEDDGSGLGSTFRPIFLCDCNAIPSHSSIRRLAGTGALLDDTWEVANGSTGGETNAARDKRIDYVFIGRQSGVPIGEVLVDYLMEGESDHYPVIAEL